MQFYMGLPSQSSLNKPHSVQVEEKKYCCLQASETPAPLPTIHHYWKHCQTEQYKNHGLCLQIMRLVCVSLDLKEKKKFWSQAILPSRI